MIPLKTKFINIYIFAPLDNEKILHYTLTTYEVIYMTNRINDNHWLINKPIAHRGLWGENIKENSLSAYKNATEHGYPIEIDVYLSADGVIMSFHDENLKRMTGAEGKIYQKSYDELRKLRLLNSNEVIPTLEEVLKIAKGKSPLLIEIKDQPNKLIVDKLVERLKTYDGEFAIQSFNPFYVNRVKKLAPSFIRGILATELDSGKSAITKYVLKHMSFNFLIKPDFISYSYTGLPIKKRKIKNKRVITWTITSSEIEQKVKPYAQNIIFEHFIPDKYLND